MARLPVFEVRRRDACRREHSDSLPEDVLEEGDEGFGNEAFAAPCLSQHSDVELDKKVIYEY